MNEDCTRDRYGVIANFDTARTTIESQLAAMFANGQRRLRLVIFFGHGLSTGTTMDSAGGDFSPRHRANLKELLIAVKRVGFLGVDFSFAAQGPSLPWQGRGEWPTWREEMYLEHWSLLRNLRPIFIDSGLPYRIDLLGEAIPTATQPMYLRYTQRMWAEYTRAFGKRDTVGFSIIPAIIPDRIAQMRRIYGDDPPLLLDLHFYHDVYELFTSAHRRLQTLGYGSIPWIIGETHYNDPENAREFSRAIRDTGQVVECLYQWPLTRERRCKAVDVSAPLEFDQYLRAGF